MQYPLALNWYTLNYMKKSTVKQTSAVTKWLYVWAGAALVIYLVSLTPGGSAFKIFLVPLIAWPVTIMVVMRYGFWRTIGTTTKYTFIAGWVIILLMLSQILI
jgi:predicted membrane protein